MRRSRISHPSHKDPHLIDKCNLTREFFWSRTAGPCLAFSWDTHHHNLPAVCVASSKWILHRLSRGQVIFHHWDQIGKNPHNQVDTPKRHRQVGLDEPHLLFLVPSIPVRWVGLILPSQVDLSYIELNLAAGDKTEKPNNLSLLLSHTSCQKHTRVQFSRGILWTMTKSPCNCFEWAFQQYLNSALQAFLQNHSCPRSAKPWDYYLYSALCFIMYDRCGEYKSILLRSWMKTGLLCATL